MSATGETEELRGPPTANALSRALISYAVVVAIVWITLYMIIRLRLTGSGIVALIVGHIALVALLFPARIDFWTEFDSFVAIFTTIQIVTPLLVVLYAIVHAFHDKIA